MKFSRLKLFSPVASTMLLVSRRNYRFTAKKNAPLPRSFSRSPAKFEPIDLKIVLDLEPLVIDRKTKIFILVKFLVEI